MNLFGLCGPVFVAAYLCRDSGSNMLSSEPSALSIQGISSAWLKVFLKARDQRLVRGDNVCTLKTGRAGSRAQRYVMLKALDKRTRACRKAWPEISYLGWPFGYDFMDLTNISAWFLLGPFGRGGCWVALVLRRRAQHPKFKTVIANNRFKRKRRNSLQQ